MGIDFYRLKYNYPYNRIPRILKKHLKVRISELVLSFDIILFFIRKHLIEYRELKITLFGILYVKRLKQQGDVLRFKNLTWSREIINGIRENTPSESEDYKRARDMDEILQNVATCLNITKAQASEIFRLFIYGIFQELLENGFCKLRNFGVFYSYEGKYKKQNNKQIRFRPKSRFRREIRGIEKEIEMLTRVSRITKLNGISSKVLVKNNSTLV